MFLKFLDILAFVVKEDRGRQPLKELHCLKNCEGERTKTKRDDRSCLLVSPCFLTTLPALNSFVTRTELFILFDVSSPRLQLSLTKMIPSRKDIYGARVCTRLPKGMTLHGQTTESNGESPPRRRWIFLSVTLLALIGMTFLVFRASEMYFRYDIASNIKVKVPPSLIPPDLSICFIYTTVLNRTLVLPKYPAQGLDGRTESNLLSISDNFNMTPGPEAVIEECRIRLRDSYLTQRYNHSECLEKLTIKKFTRLGYFCYKIGLKTSNKTALHGNFDHHRVKHSFVSPGMLYQLTLNNETFKNVKIFSAAVFDGGWYPEALQTFLLHTSRSDENFYNLFYISYNMREKILLPPPFRDGCRDYNTTDNKFNSQDMCIFTCMATTSQKVLGFIPAETTITEDLLERYPSLGKNYFANSDSYNNGTFMELLRKVRSSCNQTCHRPDCWTEYFASKLLSREKNSSFILRLFSPLEFVLKADQTPDATLEEYINTVLSLLSCWFGISCLGTGMSVLTFFSTRRLPRLRKAKIQSIEVIRHHSRTSP